MPHKSFFYIALYGLASFKEIYKFCQYRKNGMWLDWKHKISLRATCRASHVYSAAMAVRRLNLKAFVRMNIIFVGHVFVCPLYIQLIRSFSMCRSVFSNVMLYYVVNNISGQLWWFIVHSDAILWPKLCA